LSLASSWVCAWFGPFGRSTRTHWEWKRDPGRELVWDQAARLGSSSTLLAHEQLYEYGIDRLPELEMRPFPWWLLTPRFVASQFAGSDLSKLGIVAIRMEGLPIPCVAHLYRESDDSRGWVIEVHRRRHDAYLPCLIVPWPFIANTAIWAGVVEVGWWRTSAIVRRLRRRGPAVCKQCGYSLVGIASPVCPECGAKREL